MYAEFLFYPFNTHNLELLVAVLGTVYESCLRNQLSVVFVRGHHICNNSPFLRGFCQCPYDVIGLIPRNLENGDIIGLYELFYDRYRFPDYLGCLFALCLVLLIGLVPECRSLRVEGDSDVCGILLLEHILKGVDETEDCRCIESF